MILRIVNNRLALFASYEDRITAKSIPHYRWNKELTAWMYPLNKRQLELIKRAAPMVKIDPGVEATVDAREAPWALAARIREQKDVAIRDYDFATEPFNHQRIAFAFSRALDSTALFMEMGTGKTKVALDLMAYRKARGEIERTLVIAPNSVLEVWLREAEAHTPTLTGIVLQGDRATRLELMEEDRDFYIINYEATRLFLPELIKRGFQMVICDESTRIKNHSAKQSRAVHKLGLAAKYRMILTGTPVTQNPLDLFSQYKFLDPEIFGTTYHAFRNRYAVMGGYGGYEVVKWRNLEELHELTFKVAIRYLKKDCLDLPPKIYQDRIVELTERQRASYEQMKNDMITLVKGEVVVAAVVLTKLLRLQQITSGFVKTIDDEEIEIPGVNPKIEALKEIFDEVVDGNQKKVVVWLVFRRDWRRVYELAKERGYEPAGIFGDVPHSERGSEVERFQSDKNCKVFVGQIQTAGLGITLHAADTVVYYGNSFSLQDRLQSEDRTHRIGQVRPVTYVNLIAKSTVDVTVAKVLMGKRDLANLVTRDNIEAIVRGEL